MEVTAILTLASGLLALFDKALAVLAVKKQKHELTPQEEAAYDALDAARMQSSHWRRSSAPPAPPQG